MSKKITVLVDNTKQSGQVLNFIIKNNIAHNLITDENIVREAKEILDFEPPIILCYDENKNQYFIIENKKELMEIKNGS